MPKKELRRRQREAERARELASRAEETTTTIDWSLPIDGGGEADDAFPTFDDTPSAPPVAPSPPAAAPRSKGGLFGRRKSKVVPF